MRQLLFDIAIITPFTATLSVFFDFCIQDDNIFGWYGNLLTRITDKYPFLEYWAKPIGGCSLCTSFWIYLIASLIIFQHDPVTLGFIFLVSGLNYTIVRAINLVL